MNTADNQRGGIVVFAIVGVVLAGLLAGALYFGKHQSKVAKENTPAPIAIDTEKEATEAGKGAEKPSEEGAKPAAPAAPKPAPATPKPATPSAPAPATPRPAAVPNSGPSQVAATGPLNTLFTTVIVTVICFVSLVFVQSNTRLRRSALNR